MKRNLKIVTTAALLVLAGTQVHAAQLLPDIESNDLNFTTGAGTFTVVDQNPDYTMNTDSVALPNDPNQVIAYDTTYSLHATTDLSGNVTGGTIEIDSDEITEYDSTTSAFIKDDFNNYINSLPPIAILTGTLTGSIESMGITYITFDVTGGLASTGAGDLNWYGSKGLIKLDEMAHTSDVIAVPAPQATVAGSFLLGILALLRTRRSSTV
jgi:hypothetical protein